MQQSEQSCVTSEIQPTLTTTFTNPAKLLKGFSLFCLALSTSCVQSYILIYLFSPADSQVGELEIQTKQACILRMNDLETKQAFFTLRDMFWIIQRADC